MSANLAQIAGELRNRIFELVVLQEEPIDIGNFCWLPKLHAGLLRVNKTIHREVSSLFYGQNRFDFSTCDSTDIAFFLRQIGPKNANYIRDMCIDFPVFSCLESGKITLDDDSTNILANIQSYCANATTLVTSLDSTNFMEIRLNATDNDNVVKEAVELVDAQFRAIPTLRDIIVQVYEDGPNSQIRTEMEKHGWIIKTVENVEDDMFDAEFDGYGSGYYDHHYRSESESEYDIDYDSDFWRRAAD